MSFLPSILFGFLLFHQFVFLFLIVEKFIEILISERILQSDNKKERFSKMFRLAFGQSKMLDKPVVGLLHLIVWCSVYFD